MSLSRGIATAFIIVISQALASSQIFAGVVKVAVDYAYEGEGAKPKKNRTYCLSMKAGEVFSSLSISSLKSLCMEAASAKGYKLVSDGSDCLPVDVTLSSSALESDEVDGFKKSAVFQFYDVKEKSPTLKITASLSSGGDEFVPATIISLCRAAFHDIPAKSKKLDRVTGTDLDDTVDGDGFYAQIEAVTAGPTFLVGMHLSESVSLEVGRQMLEEQKGIWVPVDAESVAKTFVRSKIFLKRDVYVGLGVGFQTVEFGNSLAVESDGKLRRQYSISSNTSSGPSRLGGKVSSYGLDYSVGALFIGKSHHRGLFAGVNLGGYKPLVKTSESLEITGNSDSNLRQKVLDRVMKTSTDYYGQLFIGVYM